MCVPFLMLKVHLTPPLFRLSRKALESRQCNIQIERKRKKEPFQSLLLMNVPGRGISVTWAVHRGKFKYEKICELLQSGIAITRRRFISVELSINQTNPPSYNLLRKLSSSNLCDHQFVLQLKWKTDIKYLRLMLPKNLPWKRYAESTVVKGTSSKGLRATLLSLCAEE